MTGHKNRLSNHRFITFYHVPCPHVLMSFSSQCLQDHGRPGRILLDGEVYKCSLVGQLSKSRHCHSFKHFGCVVMQTVWNPIWFKEVWCSMQVPSCPFSANIQGGPLSNILCAPCHRLRHWMAHGPLEVLLSDPWLKGSGTNASNIK